jgi:acyl-ACP thioesterase
MISIPSKPSIRRALRTKEQRAYWASLDRIAREVARMPDWMTAPYRREFTSAETNFRGVSHA